MYHEDHVLLVISDTGETYRYRKKEKKYFKSIIIKSKY